MIARIRCRQVVENERGPEIAAVAVVTFALSHEVTRALAGRGRAVMAARARAGAHARVIEARWQPGGRRVADVALGCRL